MRRSFGPHMGGGSGGAGGGGGGGMIKTVHRAMRAGIGGGSGASATTRTTGNRHHQPINTTLSLSSNTNTPSSPCSYLNHPVPDAPSHKWTLTSAPATGEEFDWEHIDGDGSDGDSVNGFYDEFVFGNVPSEEEVHRAVSSLHEVLEPASFGRLMKNRVTYGSDDDDDDDDDGVEKVSSSTSVGKSGFGLDWTEPSMQLCYSSSALLVPSSDRVLDAFHMLQTEPLVQRMVISLSSDKAVWDAVMNNDVVRELRESITEDKSISDESEDSDNDPNPITQVLRWIFVNTKDRVIEIVEKITKVVNELVRPMNKDEKPKTDANVGINSFDEKLRSSFFLSIVVLLIVVVSRSSKG